MSITIKANFSSMIVSARDPYDQDCIRNLTGKVKEETVGNFEMALSGQNLNRLFTVFTGAKRPVVVSGKSHIDRIRNMLNAYNDSLEAIKNVLAEDSYPVPPNGKFIPYSHQTKIIGCQDVNPFGPTMADCGTGKTGSTLRSIELQFQKGTVRPGKVLISSPLSILETSWIDDSKKFTHLNVGLLWTSKQNKRILTGEDMIILDYGPKPEGAFSVKKRSNKNFYRHRETGAVLERPPNTLEDPDKWDALKGRFEYATMADGSKVNFGPVYAKTFYVEETKKNFIRDMLNDPQYHVFVINHDGVKIYEEILKEHKFEWVIVDESTKIKNTKSAVSKSHIEISWGCKRRGILTGTPNPNGFIDLWNQFFFLDRGLTLEPRMNDFLKEYFKPIAMNQAAASPGAKDMVKWVPKSKAHMERLIATVRKTGIYLDQRDCLDLPPRTDMYRKVRLSAEQEKAYLEMEENLYTSIIDRNNNNLQVEATNKLAQIMRLRQITSGYMSDAEKIVGHFKTNPKWDDLDELIEELGDKQLVISCQFTEEIHALLDRYKHLGIDAIYGGVGLDKRTKAISDFQAGRIRIIVLQPAAASHGITLTAAHYLIFLSLDYNFEFYYQIAKRIERIGQKSNMFILHSLACLEDGSDTIDSDLIEILKRKEMDRTSLFSFGKSSSQDDDEIAGYLEDRLVERVKKRKTA